MKAYLVVVTVTLGEVFACQLKKFHNLLELPCWMRGPENFGTFEGNQWQQRFLRPCWGSHPTGAAYKHAPAYHQGYIHDPQTTSSRWRWTIHLKIMLINLDPKNIWTSETNSKPNLKSKVDDPSLQGTSLSFCLPPIGEYARSYVGNHFPNNVKPQQKIFNHRLEIPILYTPEISPYLNIFERSYLF